MLHTGQVILPSNVTARYGRATRHYGIRPENLAIFLRLEYLTPCMRGRVELPMELCNNSDKSTFLRHKIDEKDTAEYGRQHTASSRITPLEAANSTRLFASSPFEVKGFSQRTCFPFLIALADHSKCSPLGVDTYTKSTCGSSRSSSYDPYDLVKWYLFAKVLAVDASRDATA